ncbi:MAG: AzlC family ABC transporter permease [Rhodospirillaceae bacterium]|nr:AzlC family ABC transporter permease [Rhodospirillaceae bacterium]
MTTDETATMQDMAPRAAFVEGMRLAAGIPAIVLASSYLGFGVLARESGLGLGQSIASTATGWALPGQIALVELYAVGASWFAIAIAVALTNARLLPMTVTLMPYLRHPGTPRWKYYLAAHYVAVTGWANTMQRAPHMTTRGRLPFFFGIVAVLWTSTLVTTAIGYQLPDLLPSSVTIGLVFLNPIYFMLIFAADARARARALALVFGAILGPLLHLVSPDWGLLATGLIAGSAAFWLDETLRKTSPA